MNWTIKTRDKINGFLDLCNGRVMTKGYVHNKGTNNEEPIATMKELN